MNVQHDAARAKYLLSLTHAEASAHDAAHEALLLNGFEPAFVREDLEDDGDGESGPHVSWYCPDHFAYRRENETTVDYVMTERGAVVHRETVDLAHERWCNEQQAEHDAAVNP